MKTREQSSRSNQDGANFNNPKKENDANVCFFSASASSQNNDSNKYS
jgi:hypothetical protein